MERSRLTHLVVAGFAWQGLSKLVVQFVTWTSTIYVARLLEPADYGLMAVAGIFTGVLMMMVQHGLAPALVQLSDVEREHEDAAFFLSLALGAVLYALLYFSAPWIAELYRMPQLVEMLRVGSVVLPLSALQCVPKALVMREMGFRLISIVQTIASLATAATVVVMAIEGWGVWSLIWGAIVMQIIHALGFLPTMRHLPRLAFGRRHLADLVHFGMNMVASNIAFVIFTRMDVFIIGRALGTQLTGYYSMAMQLATIPMDKLGSIFNFVAFAAIARAKEDGDRAKTMFMDMHRYLLMIGVPLLVGIALVAEDAVIFLLTEKWLPVVPVLQLLCVVNVLRLSAMLMSPVLNGLGRSDLTARHSMLCLVLLPVGFYFGIDYGLIGVAVAWLIAYPFAYLQIAHYLLRELALSPWAFAASLRPVLVATALMAVAVLVIQDLMPDAAFLPRLIAAGSAGAIAYMLTFVLLFRREVAGVRRAIVSLRQG